MERKRRSLTRKSTGMLKDFRGVARAVVEKEDLDWESEGQERVD